MHGRAALARLALTLLLPLVMFTPARAAGWPHDPSAALPLVVAPRGQCVYGMVPDLKGGAVVVWADPCSTYTSPAGPFLQLTVRSMHVLKRGDPDPAWPAGTPLITTTESGPRVVPDGLGGAYLGWTDSRNVPSTGRDVYVHHLRGDGTLDPAWPTQGRAVCTAPMNQFTTLLTSDAQGGVIAVWNDRRDSTTTGIDVYAARVRADGTLDPAWPVNGRAVCTAVKSQVPASAVPDGLGGVTVYWTDQRNSATNQLDVYAQHVRADGTLDPAWPAGGLAVAATTEFEWNPVAVTDSAGGTFVGWDVDLSLTGRLKHVLATGVIDPLWPAGGLILEGSGGDLLQITPEPDGHGGVFAAYDYFGSGPSAVHLRHVLANGSFDPMWPASPLNLDESPGNRNLLTPYTTVLPDGRGGLVYFFSDDLDGTGNQHVLAARRVHQDGTLDDGWGPSGRVFDAPPSRPQDFYAATAGEDGAIVAWTDLRDSAATFLDIYAQRLTEDGHLGLALPAITKVRDVPNDQGGRATIFWYASAYDTLPADPVNEYDVWRRLDAVAAHAALARGAVPLAQGEAPSPGNIRATRDGATDVFWEFLGSVPPRGTINYAFTISTRGDSTAAGAARETYEVDVHATALNYIGSSDPDSGYSVDNLAPATPVSFAGAFSGGSTMLHWDRNLEPDLQTYRLYRGIGNFTPGPANLIATLTGLEYTDNPGAPYAYKLSATDVHGNVSGYAYAIPSGTVDADGAPLPRELALAAPRPSPARATATIRFALPRAEPVRLVIFDIAGRRTRTLAAGPHAAGEFTLTWDLRDDSGHPAAPGLYLVSLEAEGRRIERRLVSLK